MTYRTPIEPGRVVEAGPGTGHWHTYDVTDGLPGVSTISIFQDREGYLWFGTYGGGVSRYDGRGFTTFTVKDGLSGNWVWSMFQDGEGYLWFGTDQGVSRYDPSATPPVAPTGSQPSSLLRTGGKAFINLTAEDGLAGNGVRSVLQDREGYLWFGTGGGVSRYDGRGFTTFTAKDGLAGNWVWSMFQDGEGHLWFGTDQGVSRYDGKAFINFTTGDGLAGNGVRSVLQDREGYLWFGTYGGGVSRYDGQTLRQSSGQAWVTFTTEDGLAHDKVLSIFQDREGYLWFGTEGGGTSRYDPAVSSGSTRAGDIGHEITTFTMEDGLASNYVLSIFQDREGYLWFGTVGGVSQYDSETFITFTTKDGLSHNDVRSIFQDREGYLWFGTAGGGVSRHDRAGRNRLNDSQDRSPHPNPGESSGVGTFTIFTAEDGLADNEVGPIFQDREGCLWFGTRGSGVSCYDPSAFSKGDGKVFTSFTTEDGLAHNDVRSIFQDQEGYLWFGTWGGVSRYDGQTFITFTTRDGLAGNIVRSIFQDREGYLWFGTWGGVSQYDGQTFITSTTRDGLAHNDVGPIFQDREGCLWFGTEGGGLSRYNPSMCRQTQDSRGDGKTSSAGSRHNFTNFTTEDGLASNHVQSIFQDRKGHLWFATWGGGVSQYDGQVFQTLTRRDGLAGNVVYSILEDREGYLWFGILGGLTRYRPPAPSLPLVFIDAVVADRRYEGRAVLEVPISVRLIAFEFHGMSFKTRPEAMIYRYWLEGYDKDWRTIRERRVEYQDLSPGVYAFHVKAVDRDLNYSDPATVRLTVVPDPRIRALAEAMSEDRASGELVGNSEALCQVEVELAQVARTGVTVLILGETGTGKGLAARAVHALSTRRKGPFIQVNCGAIPEGLVESELFGHERGAFTGAISRKLGKAELAEGGTLFLDEIGNLTPEAQGKLLLLLEERTFERVGGIETLGADVRVIAATNRDLKQMVAEGKFREDLYFRLQAFPVRMPPLRERREDIPLLAAYFMERMATHLNKEVTHLTPEALELLRSYDWPGNVRELEHAVQRAVIVCQGPAIRAEDIALDFAKAGEGRPEEIVTLEELERRYIRAVLEKTGWVIKGPRGAAALLGLNGSTLRSRMQKLGIVRP